MKGDYRLHIAANCGERIDPLSWIPPPSTIEGETSIHPTDNEAMMVVVAFFRKRGDPSNSTCTWVFFWGKTSFFYVIQAFIHRFFWSIKQELSEKSFQGEDFRKLHFAVTMFRGNQGVLATSFVCNVSLKKQTEPI